MCLGEKEEKLFFETVFSSIFGEISFRPPGSIGWGAFLFSAYPPFFTGKFYHKYSVNMPLNQIPSELDCGSLTVILLCLVYL